MENPKQDGLFGRNPFAQVFQVYDTNAFFQDLHEQVKNKSYFEQYKGFKVTVSCLSYLFNLGSALTASYAVYWLTQWITGFEWVGCLVSAIFLFFLEKIKRKSSSELWKMWFFRGNLAIGWLALSLVCFSISLVSSGFGVHQGTEELAPDAELLKADSLQTHYEGEIAKLESKNEDLRNNRNSEGITFYKLADGITANELIITDYRKRALNLEKKTDGQNEKLTTEYQEEVKLTAWTLVWLTLLMELLFEACIAYVWYYKFRAYVERQQMLEAEQQGLKTTASTPLPSTSNTDLEDLTQSVHSLKSDLEALRAIQLEKSTIGALNGFSHDIEAKNEFRQPIGFHAPQKMEIKAEKMPNAAKQIRPNLDNESTANVGGYTVEHTYTRGGKTKTVHYTMRMIKSRITQYERMLKEAKENDKCSNDTIQNRQRWVDYWTGKRTELLQRVEAKLV